LYRKNTDKGQQFVGLLTVLSEIRPPIDSTPPAFHKSFICILFKKDGFLFFALFPL